MRVVITGATSFVGAATVQEMLRRGHTIIAVVRPQSTKLNLITDPNREALEGRRLEIVENDIYEPEALPGKIAGPCEVFFHFAWGGSGSGARTDEGLQKRNCLAALETIRAAKALGCARFLFSGSQAEYGLHRTLMTEDLPCAPRSFYGTYKLQMREQAEALCRTLGMTYVHTRIFSAYGPGDHPWTLVESCLDAFTEDRTQSLGQCTQQWNFIHIDDLARAMAALAETPTERLDHDNPVYNLAGDDTRPLRAFVEAIHELCGHKGIPQFATRAENAEGVINLMPSIAKLQQATGWKPEIPFEDGIRAMLEARGRQ